MQLTDDVFASEDLGGSQDVRVDQGLVYSQEGLVAAGPNPSGLAAILGTNVGHGRGLGVPVGHVQDWPTQLPFLWRDVILTSTHSIRMCMDFSK